MLLKKKRNWKPNPNDTKQEQPKQEKKPQLNMQNPKAYCII